MKQRDCTSTEASTVPSSGAKEAARGRKRSESRSIWLRLYTEIIDDFDVEALSDAQFRMLIKLWCVAKLNDGFLPSSERIAFRLRLPVDSVKSTVAELKKRGYLELNEGVMSPHNWSARQFESDNSTERVKRFRKRFMKQDETVSRNGQVALHETAPEQSRDRDRTDTDACNVSLGVSFDEVARRMFDRHPFRKGHAAAVERALVQAVGDAVDPEAAAIGIESRHAAWAESEDWNKDGGKFCPRLPGWLESGKCFDEPPALAEQPRDSYITLAELKRVSGGAQ